MKSAINCLFFVHGVLQRKVKKKNALGDHQQLALQKVFDFTICYYNGFVSQIKTYQNKVMLPNNHF